jgi:hypothetical protein
VQEESSVSFIKCLQEGV